MSMETLNNSRAIKRLFFQVAYPGWLALKKEGHIHSCATSAWIDGVSMDRARVQTDIYLEVGQEVELGVRIPEECRTIRGTAQVLWIKPATEVELQSEFKWMIGLAPCRWHGPRYTES